MKTQKTKKSPRTLLLVASIVGFVTVVLVTLLMILRLIKNADRDFKGWDADFYYAHIGAAVLMIASFVCAMIFIGKNKSFTSTSKLLPTKTLVILNAVFWGAAFLFIILGAMCLLDVDFDMADKNFMPLMWLLTDTMILPIAIIDTIAFTKSK